MNEILSSSSCRTAASPREAHSPVFPPPGEGVGGRPLIPAIIQDHRTGKVLMLGYMNEESLSQTKATGLVTFFSRSKNRLWTKGETSGNTLQVVDILVDCDADTLLIKAVPAGPVCHTGNDTCFGETNDAAEAVHATEASHVVEAVHATEASHATPLLFLKYLQDFIARRYEEMPEGSYTTSLFTSGINRMAQKVGEEAVETVIEATNGTTDKLTGEAADLLYHLIVLLTAKGLRLDDACRELQRRHK